MYSLLLPWQQQWDKQWRGGLKEMRHESEDNEIKFSGETGNWEIKKVEVEIERRRWAAGKKKNNESAKRPTDRPEEVIYQIPLRGFILIIPIFLTTIRGQRARDEQRSNPWSCSIYSSSGSCWIWANVLFRERNGRAEMCVFVVVGVRLECQKSSPAFRASAIHRPVQSNYGRMSEEIKMALGGGGRRGGFV